LLFVNLIVFKDRKFSKKNKILISIFVILILLFISYNAYRLISEPDPKEEYKFQVNVNSSANYTLIIPIPEGSNSVIYDLSENISKSQYIETEFGTALEINFTSNCELSFERNKRGLDPDKYFTLRNNSLPYRDIYRNGEELLFYFNSSLENQTSQISLYYSTEYGWDNQIEYEIKEATLTPGWNVVKARISESF